MEYYAATKTDTVDLYVTNRGRSKYITQWGKAHGAYSTIFNFFKYTLILYLKSQLFFLEGYKNGYL